MTRIGGLLLLIELLIANLIFVYKFPKKEKYGLYAGITTILSILIMMIFPYNSTLMKSPLYSMVRQVFTQFLVILIFTCVVNIPLKRIIVISIVSSSMQHIVYVLFQMIYQVPYINTITSTSVYARLICELMFFAAMYIIIFLAIRKTIAKYTIYDVYTKKIEIYALVAIVILNLITRIPRFLNEPITLSYMLFDLSFTLLVLLLFFACYNMLEAMTKKRLAEKMLADDHKQFKIKQETIESFNIRCHDLKHMLKSYALTNDGTALDEFSKMIDGFAQSVKTGNAVIDVLLGDYSIRYNPKGITFSFVGNASLLKGIDTSDLYRLMGNALDNAIEAVEKLDSIDEKCICINIEAKGDLIMICIKNYYKTSLDIRNGIFYTTKKTFKELHGFGIKSMKEIIKKYNGNININTEDNIFYLNIYLLKQ